MSVLLCYATSSALLVLLSGLPTTEAAWPATKWPVQPAGGSVPGGFDIGPLEEKWEQMLEGIWDQVAARVSFCLGASQQGVLRLMQASFPLPLPTGPTDDAVCGNATRLALHLCGRREIQEYYKVSSCCETSAAQGTPRRSVDAVTTLLG